MGNIGVAKDWGMDNHFVLKLQKIMVIPCLAKVHKERFQYYFWETEFKIIKIDAQGILLAKTKTEF